MAFAAGRWVFRFQAGTQISCFGRGRGILPWEHPSAVSHLWKEQTADLHGESLQHQPGFEV